VSRSNYSEECDENWPWIKWRGTVQSAIRGRRGQAFLYEMLHALHALPEHRLVAENLEADGEVCALGSVGKARGLDMSGLDPDDYRGIAAKFGIAPALVQEIEFLNDEDGRPDETPEERFARVRKWIESQILLAKK
jgi:hypothetical protein